MDYSPRNRAEGLEQLEQIFLHVQSPQDRPQPLCLNFIIGLCHIQESQHQSSFLPFCYFHCLDDDKRVVLQATSGPESVLKLSEDPDPSAHP